MLKYAHGQRLVKIREDRGPELGRIEELLDRFNVFGTIGDTSAYSTVLLRLRPA